MRMNFRDPDSAPTERVNRMIWASVEGGTRPIRLQNAEHFSRSRRRLKTMTISNGGSGISGRDTPPFLKDAQIPVCFAPW